MGEAGSGAGLSEAGGCQRRGCAGRTRTQQRMVRLGAAAQQLQQDIELVDLIDGERAKELLRLAINDGVEFLEERETAGGDARPDDAAVCGITTLRDELAQAQTSQQACDIRLCGDHAVADGRAGKTRGRRAAQDAQDVVLRMGELEWPETKLEGSIELVRDAQQTQEQLGLRAGECGLAGLRGHGWRRCAGADRVRSRAWGDYCWAASSSMSILTSSPRMAAGKLVPMPQS